MFHPNIINEQLQLVVLVFPHGDQFNYFLFETSPPSQEGWWGVFFQFFVYNTPSVLDLNLNFKINNTFIHHVFSHWCVGNTFI
jgi:hypothetical protein